MIDDKAADAPDPNQPFYAKADSALRDLFEKAKVTHELHFATALMPEFRGLQDANWNTAEEAVRAYDEFTKHVNEIDRNELVRVRIILAFYMHVAESAGLYEVPKKMLLTVEGKGNNINPFQPLVKKHQKTGRAIAPNANMIMKDLMGHAWELGFVKLSEVFKEAFDADVRNAIAHADYILASNGMRLRRRNGGQVRIISWDEWDSLVNRGVNLFSIIRNLTMEFVHSYSRPKKIKSRMNDSEPLQDFTIYYIPKTKAFGITTAPLPEEFQEQLAQI